MIPHDWGDDEEEAAPRRFRGLLGALATRRFLLTAVAIALLLVGGGVAWEGLGHDVDLYGVYDGDTLEMTPHDCLLSHIGVACPVQRMRLYGVDAFESAQTCRDAEDRVWECGAVATARMRALVARSGFSCNVDTEFVDRHAREFAVCTVDGKDVGAMMVEEGLAFYYGRGVQYLPIEAEAKRLKRGAWAGNFVRPQYFRQGAD
jgi:endonuclease YncB( thermonuclease family)